VITSGYLQDEIEIGPVMLIPGVRFDHETLLNVATVDPRGAVRWRVVEPLVLKASGGIYHRVPDVDEIVEPFGNDDIEFERAIHAVGGLEWAITDVIDVDIQGYYKYLDHLVTTVKDPEPGDDRVYDNSAEGYTYGGEIMLRHNWTDDFFGWISYSVSKSMRNDGPGTPLRRFDKDQTHNAIAVASWQFSKGWRLGGRFQFTSGEPYTDIKGGILNADNGTYLPIYDEEGNNAKTMPPFHRLDLRLDKEWMFDTWILTTYLDIQNVYFQKNPTGVVRNYDHSEVVHVTSLPILPSIGAKAKF
jgi:outer membrane receptor for ferrienterochelin and colicin